MLRTRPNPLIRLLGATLVATMALGAAACLDSKVTRCPGGYLCPEGRVCDPSGLGCLHPSQLLACQGSPDGTDCTPEHTDAPHLCISEICRPSVCGDGLLDPDTEVCDDGNTSSGDGCRADCQGTEECGDGLYDPEAGEVCDDGDKDDNDQCTQLCDHVRCGDNLVSGLEACDDGDENSDTRPDACRTTCTLAACEDGVLDTPDLTDCWSPSGEATQLASPSRILAADLNGDQLDDIFVLSAANKRFEVYLSHGDGTWQKSFHYVGSAVQSLAVADLDDDGDMDVVISREALPSLQIYLGDGTGALTLHATAGLPFRPLNNVVVGDFDGDQTLDLGGLYEWGCEIDQIHGNGDGSFGSVRSSAVGLSGCWSEAMQAADLNDDGHLDLAVAAATNGVYVLGGDGAGQLASPAVYVSPITPDATIRDLAVADLDGDTLLDLVYTEQKPPQSPAHIRINQGGFQFAEAPGSPLPLGLSSLKLDVGDMTGDGVADVAVVDYFAAVVFLIHLAGDGVFQVQTPPPDGLAVNADDVAFGHFYTSGFGALGLLRAAETRVVFWRLDP